LLDVVDGDEVGVFEVEALYRRRRRIGEYNTVVWRIGHAEASSKVTSLRATCLPPSETAS
jgi:hypothetical protein